MTGEASQIGLRFGPVSQARFVARPNRFLVRCQFEHQGIQEAFLPNPGRLWELLLPGATLYVADSANTGTATPPGRKTRYTVLAVQRDGRPVFLHTHLTNAVARHLVQRRLVPELAGAEVVRAEYPIGRSRFDFLLRHRGRDVCLEVKSCTQFGNGVAMFPDAVTQRGRRHLVELASLGRRGIRPCVLFVIHTPDVQWFMPDYHTDLEFSRTLIGLRDALDIFPIAVDWHADLSLGARIKRVPIPWEHVQQEAEDRGSYVLLLKLDRRRQVRIGALGTLRFQRGYYAYVGSAMRNLGARLGRHSRRRKRLRWHVDYLRQVAGRPIALPIRSSMRHECELARSLGEILRPGPPGFGCSDCACPTHLFWHEANPLEQPAFHHVLQRFRMRRPA